jgi:DNA modification methylase
MYEHKVIIQLQETFMTDQMKNSISKLIEECNSEPDIVKKFQLFCRINSILPSLPRSLLVVKGTRINDDTDFLSNVVYSEKPNKGKHIWEQSQVAATHVISRLTFENQVVIDPMMGSGTTGIAELKLKRKFIGIEMDPQRFEIAKANLTKELNS